MGKAAKWIAGLALLAAVAGGAWWLLQGDADVRESRREVAQDPVAAPELPAVDGDALPGSAEAASSQPLALAESAPTTTSADAAAPPVFTGRVVDENGRPVAGAMVRHMPTSWQRLKLELRLDPLAPPLDLSRLAGTQTTSDGRFSLPVEDHVPTHDAPLRPGGDGLWTGSYDDVPYLLVRHPAYETRAARCVGWRGGDFGAGDIVLVPGVAVIGRAVDEHSLPLAGVSVALPAFIGDRPDARDAEWGIVQRSFHVVTGADGRFTLDGFWAVPRKLELRAPGRLLVQRSVQGERGHLLDLGDIVLPRGGVIEGVVVDLQGRPVPGANVLARPSELATWTEESIGDVAAQFAIRMGGGGDDNSIADTDAVADERGAFRFDSLDPGKAPFRIYAGAPGFEPVRSEDIAPGSAPLRVELPSVASLVLTVVDTVSKQPVTDAKVSAQRTGAGSDDIPQPLTATSAPDALLAAGVPAPHAGVFLLSPAGSKGNTAVVSAPGHATQTFKLPGVAAGERRTATVELPLALRLAGRVVNERHEPIADAKIALREPQPPTNRIRVPPEEPPVTARTQSAADGRFAFGSLAAGDWILHTAAPGFVALTTKPIALKTGAPVEDLELVLEPAGSIAGVVLKGGEPVAGKFVKAVSVAQAEAVRAAERAGIYAVKDKPPRDEFLSRTDKQGRFLLADLSPEPFELTGPEGVFVVADVKVGETTEVTLLQRGLPRVRGHVSDAKGPVAGAEINADQWMDLPFRKGWASGRPVGYSDAEGNFDVEIDGIGRFMIGAGLDKRRSPGVELTLDWEQAQWVDLKLPEPAEVSGG